MDGIRVLPLDFVTKNEERKMKNYFFIHMLRRQ